MGIVGKCFDNVRTRMDEVAMQLRHGLRMLEHDFRHECASLQVTAPLELEDIAFRADHRTGG